MEAQGRARGSTRGEAEEAAGGRPLVLDEEAVRRGRIEAVEQLFREAEQRGLDGAALANSRYGLRQSALHVAAQEGHFDLVCLLLQHGAAINAQDKNHWTPLHCAAKEHLEICQVLLEHGADVSTLTDAGTSAFHYLVRAQVAEGQQGLHRTTLGLMLRSGQALDVQNESGESPLHQASLAGRVESVQWLLEHGAALHCANKYGETALHFAARNGSEEVVGLLLAAGADAAVEGAYGTPRAVAENFNQAHIVALLDQWAADDASDSDGDDGLGLLAEPLQARAMQAHAMQARGPSPAPGPGRPPLAASLSSATSAGGLASLAGASMPRVPLEGGQRGRSLAQKRRFLTSSRLSSSAVRQPPPNGPARTDPRQRRLRHVRAVLVRSIRTAGPRRLPDTYFTLSVPSGADGAPLRTLYTSTVQERSLNPSWTNVQLGQLQAPAECRLVFRLWEVDGDGPMAEAAAAGPALSGSLEGRHTPESPLRPAHDDPRTDAGPDRPSPPPDEAPAEATPEEAPPTAEATDEATDEATAEGAKGGEEASAGVGDVGASEAALEEAQRREAELQEAQLQEAQLQEAQLRETQLQEAQLQEIERQMEAAASAAVAEEEGAAEEGHEAGGTGHEAALGGSLVLEVSLRLHRLAFVGERLLDMTFPDNLLLLELADGYYVREDLSLFLQAAPARGKQPAAQEARKKMYKLGTVKKILAAQARLEQVRQRSVALEQEAAAGLALHRRLLALRRRRDHLAARVDSLRRSSREHQLRLDSEREHMERSRAAILPRAQRLNKALLALVEDKQQLAARREALEAKKARLADLQELVAFRRSVLIRQLRHLLPISQTPDQKALCINKIRLPNSDFAGCDEELVATALGLVCQMLQLISKWLDVPLRYRLEPMASRSAIRDEISTKQHHSSRFPLHARGVERTRFDYGVYLLNKNVEQLLNSQGLDIITLRHTLANLQLFLISCGKPPTRVVAQEDRRKTIRAVLDRKKSQS